MAGVSRCGVLPSAGGTGPAANHRPISPNLPVKQPTDSLSRHSPSQIQCLLVGVFRVKLMGLRVFVASRYLHQVFTRGSWKGPSASEAHSVSQSPELRRL